VKQISKQMRWSVIVGIVTIGMMAWAQYGLSSSTRPNDAENTLVHRQTEGEWLEFIDDTVIVRQVSAEQAAPTVFPYVYLSKDWDVCVEYTHDAPKGRACSDVFDQLLKNADRFDVKDAV